MRAFTEKLEMLGNRDHIIQKDSDCRDQLGLHLIRLIGIFNLNDEHLFELHTALQQMIDSQNLSSRPNCRSMCNAVLQKLAYISKVELENGQRLQYRDLKDFITELGDTLKNSRLPSQGRFVPVAVPVDLGQFFKKAKQLLKTRFEKHFPPSYFLTPIPEQVKADVVCNITNPADQASVLKWLEQLQLSGQTINYQALVSSLFPIVNKMLPLERPHFLQQLVTLLPESQDVPANLSDQLSNLLAALQQESSRRAFTLFFDLKQKLPTHQQVNLAKGVLLALQNWIRYQQFSPASIQGRKISRVQASQLSIHLLLLQTEHQSTEILPKLEQVLDLYDALLQKYPVAQQHLWGFLQSYQQGMQPSPHAIEKMLADLEVLTEIFGLLTSDQVLSLCFHFNGIQEADDLGRTPEKLLIILRDKRFIELTDEEKTAVLTMFVAVLNQEKNPKLNDIYLVIEQLRNPAKKEVLLPAIKSCYQSIPFPSMDKFLSWCENIDTLESQVKAFNLRPCQRETGRQGEKKVVNGYKNGFHLDEASRIASKFEGFKFSPEEIDHLAEYTEEVRGLSVEKLLEFLAQYKKGVVKANVERQFAALVAISAELLYRAKGIASDAIGSSYEINTTQYLALYAALKSGYTSKDVMMQMGTGEGKSRCVAILNICSLAQGKSVDFLTRSLELATRDYLEYHALYRAVNQKLASQANLISVSSGIGDYPESGLVASDVSHLQRFRSKANVLNQGQHVLNPDTSKRMLVVDEVDLYRLHHLESKYTLSSAPDADWHEMSWIYDAIMDFFGQDDERPDLQIHGQYRALSDSTSENDFIAFDQKFLSFVQYHAVYSAGYERLKKLAEHKPQRLDELYQAAYQARHLPFEGALGFGVEPDAMLELSQGAAQYSLVFPMVDKVAKFSKGVQQCLSVRLNRYYAIVKKHQQDPASLSEWERGLLSKEARLMKVLSECEKPFYVGIQKQAEYITTNRDLFDDYQDGHCVSWTGTTGEAYEVEELKTTHIIKVPRHLGLNRQDKAILLADHQERELQILIQSVKEARKLKQPILLLCADDNETARLHEALKGILGDEHMQRVSSYADGKDLAEHVAQAGKAGMLTLATEKFGRGTDIKLSSEAKSHGLRTLINFLPPTERELEQMLSRSARFGDPGETRLILNTESLKELYGSSSLKRDFYLAPETFVRQIIAKINRRKQCERVILDEISVFHRHKQKQVIDEKIYPKVSNEVEAVGDISPREHVRRLWAVFLQTRSVIWEQTWTELKASLDPEAPNLQGIREQLGHYQGKLKEPWEEFKREIQQIAPDLALDLSSEGLPNLVLSDKFDHILGQFDLEQRVPHRIVAYSKYDDAHDGRAIVYSKPFVKLGAILTGRRSPLADIQAWYRGEGVLWPNLQAWRAGKLNLFQALTCYNGTFFQFITGTDTTKIKPLTKDKALLATGKREITNKMKLEELLAKKDSPTVLAIDLELQSAKPKPTPEEEISGLGTSSSLVSRSSSQPHQIEESQPRGNASKSL